MAVRGLTDLTIFVGTFNRLETLERCIENLERQDFPLRIVIVDNGSKDQAAIELLKILEHSYTVYWLPPNEEVETTAEDEAAHGGRTMSAVQRNYSAAFEAEWEAGRRTGWFAVCDSDTAPDESPESISRYVTLARETGYAVGPHLNLNIHRNYPLRSLALIQGARVLFRHRMQWLGDIPYSVDDIDSTFHLFPASPHFDRLKMSTVRVGPPYWTTHTDWMTDVCNPTPENHTYILGASEAASWSGTWLQGWFRAWLRSPEEAFSVVAEATKWREDYLPDLFILSWMLQYGHGCERDIERSRAVLRYAMPSWSPAWEYERYWEALVYDDDHSCLGW